MKILIVTPLYPPEIGGPATYTKLLEERLPNYGIEVDTVKFSDVKYLPKFIRHLVLMFKIIKKTKGVNIIYAQDPVSVGLVSMLVSLITGVQLWVRVPGDYAWEQARQKFGYKNTPLNFQLENLKWPINFLSWIQKKVVNKSSYVIVPSHYFGDIVKRWLKQSEKLHVIHNGVELPPVLDNTVKVKKKSIVTAGRLIKGKGFETLISMMMSLPEWTLNIAGDGPEREFYQNLIKKYEVSDRVFLLGLLSKNDLFQLLKSSTVFVLNTDFETFSFQTLEAMACGVPVVVSDVGGLPEVVEHEVQGYLVNPDDTEAIVSYIKLIDNDSDLSQYLSQNAVIQAESFSSDKVVSKLVSLIKNVNYES